MAQDIFRWVQTQGCSLDNGWRTQKCIGLRQYSPKKGHLRRLAINLAPSRRVRAWGNGFRMPVFARVTWMPASLNPYQTDFTNCHRNQDTPGLIRVRSHTADRGVSKPSDAQRMHTHYSLAFATYGIWWLPHPTGMCGTRPFFWWVRAQGRSPHAPGIFGIPIGIPVIRALQAPGNEPNPLKEVKAWGELLLPAR